MLTTWTAGTLIAMTNTYFDYQMILSINLLQTLPIVELRNLQDYNFVR